MSARSLLLFGSKPELLQRSQVIVGIPVLDYLASFDAADGDEGAFYLSASGRSELLRLSLVSTALTRVTTLSPSATTSSTVTFMSGKALL